MAASLENIADDFINLISYFYILVKKRRSPPFKLYFKITSLRLSMVYLWTHSAHCSTDPLSTSSPRLRNGYGKRQVLALVSLKPRGLRWKHVDYSNGY